MRIVLLPVASRVTGPQVERLHPTAPLVACDFYIERIEREGTEVPGGYRLGRITNVDHHAPTPRMQRRVTSTLLAIERVRALGPTPADHVVVINHTDCDSVLSSAVVSGDLPPDDDLGEASIAADHTGAENPVADLLQSLNDDRSLDLSLDSLARLRTGMALGPRARAALHERHRKRKLAADLAGRFQTDRGLAWAVLDENTDSEFFPAFLPGAALILLAIPVVGDPGRHVVRLRLGTAAPAGLTIDALDVPGFDPGYGGRWNAGANKRSGGTAIPPEAYAAEVALRLDRALGRAGHSP